MRPRESWRSSRAANRRYPGFLSRDGATLFKGVPSTMATTKTRPVTRTAHRCCRAERAFGPVPSPTDRRFRLPLIRACCLRILSLTPKRAFRSVLGASAVATEIRVLILRHVSQIMHRQLRVPKPSLGPALFSKRTCRPRALATAARLPAWLGNARQHNLWPSCPGTRTRPAGLARAGKLPAWTARCWPRVVLRRRRVPRCAPTVPVPPNGG